MALQERGVALLRPYPCVPLESDEMEEWYDDDDNNDDEEDSPVTSSTRKSTSSRSKVHIRDFVEEVVFQYCKNPLVNCTTTPDSCSSYCCHYGTDHRLCYAKHLIDSHTWFPPLMYNHKTQYHHGKPLIPLYLNRAHTWLHILRRGPSLDVVNVWFHEETKYKRKQFLAYWMQCQVALKKRERTITPSSDDGKLTPTIIKASFCKLYHEAWRNLPTTTPVTPRFSELRNRVWYYHLFNRVASKILLDETYLVPPQLQLPHGYTFVHATQVCNEHLSYVMETRKLWEQRILVELNIKPPQDAMFGFYRVLRRRCSVLTLLQRRRYYRAKLNMKGTTSKTALNTLASNYESYMAFTYAYVCVRKMRELAMLFR